MWSFHQDWVSFLADQRTPPVTALFQVFSFLGEIEGYLILIAILYAAYDKRLAVQSTFVVLTAMIANHLLKILIKNPRPFTADGTHFDNWAVSAQNAAELAAEYSTPSGHAMAAAAIYGFLFLRVRHPWARAAFAAACVLTGVARPIIGVHFVEDILLGWALGLGLAFAAHRYADRAWELWCSASGWTRLVFAAGVCAAVWLATLVINPRDLSDQPTAFVSYLGFFFGVALAAPVEAQRVGYFADGANPTTRVLRFLLMLALLVTSLPLLDVAGAALAPEGSGLGFALRFMRYALVAALGTLGAAWMFKRLGLAGRSAPRGVAAQ